MTVLDATTCLADPPAKAAGRPTSHGSAYASDLRSAIAMNLERWRAKNRFYQQRKAAYLKFIIPEGQSVLLIGCEDGDLLTALEPSRGVGVDSCAEMISRARDRNPQHRYATAVDHEIELDETFDYVVLDDVMGDVRDLFTFLGRIARLCTASSRIVIVQHNYLWRPVLRLAAWLGAKRPETRQNWLSVGDLRVILEGVGLETIDVRSKLFCPKRLCGLGIVMNYVAGLLPFMHRFASTEILVARRSFQELDPSKRSASIVLTVRDEVGNIEPMIRAIPDVGRETEIVLVEGHSTDGTREEILRVIEAYPDRNIRLLVQDGIGQGDAIHKGFSESTGDVVILLEADQTSPPDDVLKAFEIVAAGRADYVNGSRFIYPREKGSMPSLNLLGNWMFAVWFTWFLGQRTSDVLCGLKAIDRRQFARLRKRWGFLGLFDPFGDFELIFGAAALGLKICEVPTRYSARQYGEPKSRFFTHGAVLVRMAARATRVFKCR